jgi:hypothetical protein
VTDARNCRAKECAADAGSRLKEYGDTRILQHGSTSNLLRYPIFAGNQTNFLFNTKSNISTTNNP